MTVNTTRSTNELLVSVGESFEVTVSATADTASIYTIFEETSDSVALQLNSVSSETPETEVLTETSSWVSAVTESNQSSLDITYEGTIVEPPGEEVQLSGTVVTADEEVQTGATTITVEQGPPAIVGEDPPQDLNDDGLYEDINGDGEFDIFDVQALFDNLNDQTLQDNSKFFNFAYDNPNEVTIFDVQALFNQL